MTLKELNIFYHLCDDAHLSNLAQKLGITQSAISLAIKSLEQKIGEPLFDRIGKKFVLNETGRLFKERTYLHFMALNDAQNFFISNTLSGILKIASSKTIGNFVTSKIIFDFLQHNERVQIQKESHNSAQIIHMVKNAIIDVGFIESTCDDPDIIKEAIGNDELIVVTSDKSLANKTVYVDELFSKKWILREKGSGTREVFLEALGDIAQNIKLCMEFSEFEEAKILLLSYPQAMTCVSRVVVEKELERGELFEVRLKNLSFKRTFHLIYHKNKYPSKLFSEFKQFVLQHTQH